MGCKGSKQESGSSPKTTMAAPTAADMAAAKMLHVTLKMDYTKNPDVKSVDSLKFVLGEGGATAAWAALGGLRHKYFVYDSETDTCSGVYVFYNQKALDEYMDSELFKAQGQYPHVSKVEATVLDVIPGTELSIEKTAWPSTPPTRAELVQGKMLIVDITMKYDTGVEGLPTKPEELYGFMAAPPNGMGYPGQFGGLKGLRGKYFCYNKDIDHCYGFYTFINQAGLDEYMASDLFKQQGEPPHIADLKYKVHDILPGTERAMDLGSWGGK